MRMRIARILFFLTLSTPFIQVVFPNENFTNIRKLITNKIISTFRPPLSTPPNKHPNVPLIPEKTPPVGSLPESNMLSSVAIFPPLKDRPHFDGEPVVVPGEYLVQ